jgi:4a-hydroxytetrahydrobiopterin dehydratase
MLTNVIEIMVEIVRDVKRREVIAASILEHCPARSNHGRELGMKESQGKCDLASRQCVPCRGGVPPLKGEELKRLHGQIEGWEVIEEHHLRKTYRFKDFVEALAYVNRLGEMAEEQGHHPDIYLSWGKVRIEIWTHKIDGLTESDFVFAAKCDAIHSGG